MIKINLLESVTDRPQGVAAVEDKVANPRAQTLLLALTVFGLLALGISYEYVSTNRAYGEAQKQLDHEKGIQQQMLAIQKEQQELQKKTEEAQKRIDAIKKRRESQQGPSAALQEIKARFDAVRGLYLVAIENKDRELTIQREPPNEASVPQFGQRRESSGGLFSNLNLETPRDPAQEVATAAAQGATTVASQTTV